MNIEGSAAGERRDREGRSQDAQAWVVGLVVSLVTLVLATVLWPSRGLQRHRSALWPPATRGGPASGRPARQSVDLGGAPAAPHHAGDLPAEGNRS
jgi:hypothetical protein